MVPGSLGYAYAVAGRRGQALDIVEELWLENAYEERDPWATDLKIQPMFDSLQSHPRFIDLLRRVGLK